MIHNEALRERFEMKFSGEIIVYCHVTRLVPSLSIPRHHLRHLLGIVTGQGGSPTHVIPAAIVCGERDEILELARKLNRDRLRVPTAIVRDILVKVQAAGARGQQQRIYYDDAGDRCAPGRSAPWRCSPSP
jgi:hypothetical protein